MTQLPINCYKVEQIRQLEALAIEQLGITADELMKRAGKVAFSVLQDYFPLAQHIAVLCGKGNNAGDGYVLARLAHLAGLHVTVFYLGSLDELPVTAHHAYQLCQDDMVNITPFSLDVIFEDYDVVVDALLGIGIKNEVRNEVKQAIDLLNNANVDVLAMDIPSGLNADTGSILGAAVRASTTITFIGVKQGLLTAQGLECCGDLVFDNLDLTPDIYDTIPVSALRLEWQDIKNFFLPRQRNSHKGDFGHVLVIGGDYGMAGAVRLAAQAAARVGAGLVTIATRAEHVSGVIATHPELMCYAINEAADLLPLIQRATVIVIGPGLGDAAWSKQLWQLVLTSKLPLVVDASALHLLAQTPAQRKNWILTPHPGEAARLLESNTQQIQQDRFAAALSLQQKYHGIIVLKGAGTLIQTADSPPTICALGNPGMSSAGMGDVLSGIIAGLVAQQFDLPLAAELGVCLHAVAGDLAAEDGERGLLASDLINKLRQLVN